MLPIFLVPFSLVRASCTMSSSGEDDTAVAPARSTALAVSPSYRADVASAAAEASDGTSSGASSRGQAALLLVAVVATSRLVVTELKLRHVFREQINLVYTSEFLYVTYQRQFCCVEVSNTNGLKF